MVERAPGQYVDELDVGVADDEAARWPGGDSDLDGQGDRRAGRGLDRGEGTHGGLHGQGAGHGAPAVVAVQPAGDGVAGETHDAATVAVQFGDERFVDGVDLVEDFFRAALHAQLLGQRGCQRGEAGDVGEEDGPGHAVG